MDLLNKTKPMTLKRKLKSKDLKGIASYIKSNDVKKVVFLFGAGISTSAGIPDFRSPKTGLYDNLDRLNLPYAEAVFDIDFFKNDPKPFYVLAEELYPGKYKPTLMHFLTKMFYDKGLLQRVYTQNIDTLERLSGIPDEKIVEAHGSFAKNHCIKCKTEMSTQNVKHCVENKKIPKCEKCNGYVKPDIVFYGEGLPETFFTLQDEDLKMADLVIIAGTSLTVYPFASLPEKSRCPRVLINFEKVGYIGERKDDVINLSDCDNAALELARYLGWDESLKQIAKEYNNTVDTINTDDPETSIINNTHDKNTIFGEDDSLSITGNQGKSENNSNNKVTETKLEPEEKDNIKDKKNPEIISEIDEKRSKDNTEDKDSSDLKEVTAKLLDLKVESIT